MKTIGTRIALIRLMNTILGLLVCLKRETFNIAHLGTHPIECFFALVRVGCNFKHSVFNIIRTISKSLLTHNFMNDLGISMKINGRINVAGTTVEPRSNEYGYFPFSCDEFFITFLMKNYCKPLSEEQINKLKSWYEFVSKNHSKSDDCEVSQQNILAGCNITSRNISYTPKRVNHIFKIDKLQKY